MAEGKSHFLDLHRATLVQTIDDVATTLDILLGKGWLTNEQYARIMGGTTTQQKMRELLDCTRGWDHSSKDELCQYLKLENKNLAVFNRWKLIQHDRDYKYGCVLDVECSGASKETAIRNNLAGETGVEASHTIAKRDEAAIRALSDKIVRVGKRRGIDPALIAGLISRASNAGALLEDGWGQGRSTCFGLMQVSSEWHTLRGEWDSEEHLDQGTEILVGMIEAIKRTFPDWRPAWHLKGGTAAYMCGQETVHSYKDVDEHTDNKDFSNDVTARAHWFKKNIFQSV